MKKIFLVLGLVLFCSNGFGQEYRRTLGGFGAGGMTGGGFGDPVANDYAGIDLRNDFISARMQGYSVEAAKQYARRMSRVRAARNQSYIKQYGPNNGINRPEINNRSIKGRNPWINQWFDLK